MTDKSEVQACVTTGPRVSLRHALIIAPLIFLLVVWLCAVSLRAIQQGGPAASGLDGDFAMFYSASSMVERGENPYNHEHLYRSEMRLLRQQHVPTRTHPAWVRVGNPPLFFWTLEPVTRIRYRAAGWLWTASLLLISAAAGLAFLAAAGWSRRALPLLVFLIMPPVLFGYFNGNVSPIVMLGVALGIWSSRRYPVCSGICLTLAWLKPTVALPLVLLIILFHAGDWKRTVAAFGAATGALVLLNVLVLGTRSFAEWVHGLVQYSRDMASQPEISSLSALYVHRASPTLRTGFELTGLAIAVGLTAWCWMRRGTLTAPIDTAWLWFAWFLATPYAHVDDVSLVTPAVLAILGRNGRMASYPLSTLVIYLLFAGILVVPILLPIALEPLALLAVAICLAAATCLPVYRGTLSHQSTRATAGTTR